MISIIICSVKPELLNIVQQSISKTIGCAYEIVVINNSSNQHSIYTAYHEGSSKAKYNILCFIHEDIEFYSNNWGPALIAVFENDKNIGLIGACGSTIKTEIPSSWIDVPSNLYVTGLVNEPLIEIKDAIDDYNEVVVIDGLFMATTKKVWSQIDFPSWTGFHGYDLMLSLLIGNIYKVVVLDSLAVWHKSEGSFNKDWFDVTFKIHKIFESSLPRSVVKDKVLVANAYSLNSLRFIKRLFITMGLNERIILIVKYILLNNNIKLIHRIRALYFWAIYQKA